MNKENTTNNDSNAHFSGLGCIKEAIILAGGLGTRLRDAVPDLPKCMAPVADRPFLFHVINYLRSQGIEKFIFSLGYKHEVIEDYLYNYFSTLHYDCVIEEEPLGTGGAIQLALQKATTQNILIANGDTLFKVNVQDAGHFHINHKAECTLLLKPMLNFDRYGVVECSPDNRVINFKEKQFYSSGTINGGLYILNVASFSSLEFPNKFSFEKEYLESMHAQRHIYAQAQDAYFIDIGIPEDFNRAQTELRQSPLDIKTIDKSWTIFLDRDGVINKDKVGSYIFNTGEFQFMPGAPQLFKKLNEKFGHIIIVTNQRGIGRGLMTEEDLTAIHTHMKNEISAAGGKVDDIYYATSTDNNDILRKPNPGMAHAARAKLPAIDLSKSIIVGNKLSDMQFGKNAGMYTVFVATTNPEVPFPHPDIDLRFDGLDEFVETL